MRTTTHRRLTALVGTALAVALALAGCSEGSQDGLSTPGEPAPPVGPGPNGASPAAPAPAPPSPPITPSRPTGPTSAEGPTRGLDMTDPALDPRSTFALDIDTGSYTRFRDAVSHGYRLAPSEVRTEEFVNYFQQDYEAPQDGLDVSIDAATLPFEPGHRLVRVGIRSADVADAARRDADLALVVDCSGSMREDDKMETTKAALRTLVAALRPTDRVAMVCYSTDASVVLEPTPVSERGAALRAIDELIPQESTNVAAGLALGYDLARSMRTEGRMSRVVLVSDGVANVGETAPETILGRVSAEARAGTSLISVGVGIQTYNDRLLEQLADQGDGWHVYLDTAGGAERVFATGLTDSLVITAHDAKAQIEFDPARVAGYRLLGYENRAVADEDFRNDAVDGGEVFAGHATTALYDVELRGGVPQHPFITATIRYLDDSGRAVERTRWLADADCVTDLDEAPPRLRQDLVIAMLTDHLVGGPWSEWVSPAALRAEAATLPAVLDGDADVAELVHLIDRATA